MLMKLSQYYETLLLFDTFSNWTVKLESLLRMKKLIYLKKWSSLLAKKNKKKIYLNEEQILVGLTLRHNPMKEIS